MARKLKTALKPASLARIRAHLKERHSVFVEVDGMPIELRAPKWRHVNQALRTFWKGEDSSKMDIDNAVDFYCTVVRLCLVGDHAKLTNNEIEDLISAGKGATGELVATTFDLCGLPRPERAEDDPTPFGSPAPPAAA